MSDYSISKVYDSDKQSNRQVDELLLAQGIRRDANLDYTCAMYDKSMNVIATGSCFSNTLRCLAVSSQYQGEGLMNEIMTHLIQYQFSRHYSHIFLYTKYDSWKFFRELGFYEIAQVKNNVVFMENKRNGFADYLEVLAENAVEKTNTAAIVINANPFSLGHLYLVEKAAAENDIVHLFMVSEDASLIPYTVRKRLIMDGTAHLNNIQYHDSGPYIISNATFPSYFQRDKSAVIESHALLDLTIFTRIASVLDINRRYVGEEPSSLVTGLYNQIMTQLLPEHNIDCIVIPRKEIDGQAISASHIRQALKEGNMEKAARLVPQSTLDFFLSEEAQPILEQIQKEREVIHY